MFISSYELSMSIVSGIALVREATGVVEDDPQDLFSISGAIADMAQSIRVNRDLALSLSRRVDELVAVVAAALEVDTDPALNLDTQEARAAFRRTLAEVQTYLHEQTGRSYLAQLLHWQRDADEMRDLLSRMQEAFDVLRVQLGISILSTVEDRYQRPVDAHLLDSLNQMSIPDTDSKSPAPKIPSAAQIFFGRESEAATIVEQLVSDSSAYVAVLGGPGIGKTSLASSVLHAARVAAHFGPRRYFLACDSADRQSGCLDLLCSAFGISTQNRSKSERELKRILSRGPTLVVLDNFESAWENSGTRSDAEGFLAFLSAIDSASLIVTLRGTERPAGISWTRPFLPPLEPLSQSAATQTFLALTDVSDADPHLSELLGYIAHVPLAITLMANLSQTEPLEALAMRWQDVRTAMLKTHLGDTRLTSLDVSISLSLQSPRIQRAPHAVDLLSLLALLPLGSMDSDIGLWSSQLSDWHLALSALLQSALAYRAADGRVMVLAPIREYVLANHLPSDAMFRPLYDHYVGLSSLIQRAGARSSSPAAIAAVAPELGNIEAVIRYAFTHAEDVSPAVEASVNLARLLLDAGLGSYHLVPVAVEVARQAHLDRLTADLLDQWAKMAGNAMIPFGDAQTLWREARVLYEACNNVAGLVSTRLNLSQFLDPQDALRECIRARDIVLECGGSIAMSELSIARWESTLGHDPEALRAFDRAIAEFRSLGEPEYRALARALLKRGTHDFDYGRVANGISSLEEALPLFVAARDKLGANDARMQLGEMKLLEGNAAAAIEYLSPIRNSGFLRNDIETHRLLTKAHLALGDERAAEAMMHGAGRLIASSTDIHPFDRSQALQISCEMAVWHGDLESARALIADAIRIGRSVEMGFTLSLLLDRQAQELLGKIEEAAGDLWAAAGRYTTVAVMQRKFIPLEVVRALVWLAQVLPDDEGGEALVRALLLPLQRSGLRGMLGDALLQSAAIAHRKGEVENARHRSRSAIKHYESINNARDSAKALAFLESCRLEALPDT
ncbi:hypothetical protein EXIGLDRAFT_747357 [Exidia glandulosa HHB12029]|uniref:Novel STAND NTPase 1 domain-containing protein n=1 Tax=Exidia glandulosa HHB12029 TaxID=1314781 RepID=A0A165KVR3_EXIGL|nr:hypothetical protein EXIGLDRAFT_747357 [Exidia glandulosa HHB12029]